MAGRYSWASRISWGAIAAGVFIGIATQLTLAALGAWIGFGLADVTSIEAMADISTGVGIWIAISALVGLFAGAFAASWLAGTRTFSDGLWHGATVWGLTLVLTVMLSISGVGGVLGFALAPGDVIDFIPGIDAAGAATAAADISGEFAGWFFIGAVASLITAFLGGWLGTYNRGSLAQAEVREEAEIEERRAA